MNVSIDDDVEVCQLAHALASHGLTLMPARDAESPLRLCRAETAAILITQRACEDHSPARTGAA